DLAPIDAEFLLFESFRHVLCGDGAEELIVLARLLRDGNDSAHHQLGEVFRFALLLRLFAQVRLTLLLHDLLVRVGGRDGQFLRQQEIAGISRGDLDHVAAVAQSLDVFSQNDFHFKILSLTGILPWWGRRFRLPSAPAGENACPTKSEVPLATRNWLRTAAARCSAPS